VKVSRILRIHHEDALQELRRFLSAWWQRIELDGLLAPVELPDHAGTAPQVINCLEDLKFVNPFLPMMQTNSAPMVDAMTRDHPDRRFAAMLRPCEIRALVELRKRNRVHTPASAAGNHQNSPVLIGVDCSGTCTAAEYARQLEQCCESVLSRAALLYGCHDDDLPYPVRMACQMCDMPTPLGADVVIGSLDIAPQGHLLVISSNEKMDADLKLAEVTDGLASEAEVRTREIAAARLSEKRLSLRSELINKRTWQAEDLNSIMAMFARCTLCADCLDECPLYDGELSGMLGVKESHQRTNPLLTELVGVSRWLASCSGCGMCQEICEHGVSLTPIIVTLSHRIQQELNYKPGDPDQRLPWTI